MKVNKKMGVQGSGVQGSGVQGFRVQGFRVQGFRVQGFRVLDSEFKVSYENFMTKQNSERWTRNL
jgi:hypothetical protein